VGWTSLSSWRVEAALVSVRRRLISSFLPDTELVSSVIVAKIPTPSVPTKAQHRPQYEPVPAFLRRIREEAGMTQRQIGEKLDRPQSWVYNCETGNRRVDVAEFCAWCRACRISPATALRRLGLNDAD
jgi:hypothetical protein